MLFNPLGPPILGEKRESGDTPEPPAKGLGPSALPDFK